MFNAVFRIFDGEGWGRNLRKLVEELVEGVVHLMNEVDWVRFEPTSMFGRKRRIVVETNEICVAMIRC